MRIGPQASCSQHLPSKSYLLILNWAIPWSTPSNQPVLTPSCWRPLCATGWETGDHSILEEIPPPAPPETSACTPIPSSLYMGLEVCHVPVSPSQADLGSPHVMTLPGVPSLRYTHHHHHYCLVTSGPDPRPPSRLLILLLSEQGRPLQAGRMEALPIRLALAAFCHPVPSGLIFHCSLLWPPHCLPSRAVGSPARLPFGPFFPPDIPSLINCTSHSTWPVATN